MTKVEYDLENYFTFRLTPWDTRAFGFETSEIMDISYNSENGLQEVFKLIDELNKSKSIKFTYTRVNSSDKILKHYLAQNGFYYAETSFKMTKNDVQEFDFLKNQKINLNIKPAETNDIDDIKNIVLTSFSFGRFIEDFNISEDKAKLRYVNWIDDLIFQKKEIYVVKLNKKAIGFHIQNVINTKAELILTGTCKTKTLISLPLWASVFNMNKERGITHMKSLISASNIGVINLYSYFHFKFEETLIGFHKIY